MALRTHFNQPEIGCPGVAEFTVQRTEALFHHITGLRQISVTFGLRFRQICLSENLKAAMFVCEFKKFLASSEAYLRD